MGLGCEGCALTRSIRLFTRLKTPLVTEAPLPPNHFVQVGALGTLAALGVLILSHSHRICSRTTSPRHLRKRPAPAPGQRGETRIFACGCPGLKPP